ncbi:hypothetical protein [Leucothrix arctica]|uniref:Uncharacterized protein n=1 Tax=Leucothrix arctica TaxID=1481894 RepID=A0A317CAG8_9GAMM|nr:hypothetical protein [Leucothrix arctica]PWQ95516.1 hypothetical protein DKT75_12080 [Leucothrix arctica]
MSADHQKKLKTSYWLKLGFLFSIGLFCFTVAPKIAKDQLTTNQIAMYVLAYLVAGAAYGLVSKKVYLRAHERDNNK